MRSSAREVIQEWRNSKICESQWAHEILAGSGCQQVAGNAGREWGRQVCLSVQCVFFVETEFISDGVAAGSNQLLQVVAFGEVGSFRCTLSKSIDVSALLNAEYCSKASCSFALIDLLKQCIDLGCGILLYGVLFVLLLLFCWHSMPRELWVPHSGGAWDQIGWNLGSLSWWRAASPRQGLERLGFKGPFQPTPAFYDSRRWFFQRCWKSNGRPGGHPKGRG